MPAASNGPVLGPVAPHPWTFYAARAITVAQAVLAFGGLSLYAIAVLSPDMRRPFGWADIWFVLGMLGFMALAVTSSAGLRPRKRGWATWGAIATNLVMALAWIALIVSVAIATARSTGTDPGMVLVAVTFLGLPTIVVSVAAVVMLAFLLGQERRGGGPGAARRP
jgi:hypothetical protein